MSFLSDVWQGRHLGVQHLACTTPGEVATFANGLVYEPSRIRRRLKTFNALVLLVGNKGVECLDPKYIPLSPTVILILRKFKLSDLEWRVSGSEPASIYLDLPGTC